MKQHSILLIEFGSVFALLAKFAVVGFSDDVLWTVLWRVSFCFLRSLAFFVNVWFIKKQFFAVLCWLAEGLTFSVLNGKSLLNQRGYSKGLRYHQRTLQRYFFFWTCCCLAIVGCSWTASYFWSIFCRLYWWYVFGLLHGWNFFSFCSGFAGSLFWSFSFFKAVVVAWRLQGRDLVVLC